jgi:putative FmdB family regulatory protein
MMPYNHVCEDCGHEWESAQPNDTSAAAQSCPKCGSDSTQAFRAGD